jgi:hypothetical protein
MVLLLLQELQADRFSRLCEELGARAVLGNSVEVSSVLLKEVRRVEASGLKEDKKQVVFLLHPKKSGTAIREATVNISGKYFSVAGRGGYLQKAFAGVATRLGFSATERSFVWKDHEVIFPKGIVVCPSCVSVATLLWESSEGRHVFSCDSCLKMGVCDA